MMQFVRLPLALALSILAVLLVLVVQPRAQAQDLYRIIVVVNGTPITEYDLNQQLDITAKAVKARKPDITPEELRSVLSQQREPLINKMIEDALLKEEVERLELSVDPAQIDAYIKQLRASQGIESDEQFQAQLAAMGVTEEGLKKKVEDDMLKQRLVQGMVGSKLVVTDLEIQEAFEKDPQFEGGVRYHLAAIVVPTEEEMRQVVEEIDDDDKTFEEAAKAYSVGPAAESGGDLGSIAQSSLSASWLEAIEGLEVGEMSEPFQMEGSQVLLKVIGIGSLTVDDVPGMRDKIFNALREQKLNKLFGEYMDRLKGIAVIEWK